jgi:hypothetical protein
LYPECNISICRLAVPFTVCQEADPSTFLSHIGGQMCRYAGTTLCDSWDQFIYWWNKSWVWKEWHSSVHSFTPKLICYMWLLFIHELDASEDREHTLLMLSNSMHSVPLCR